MNKIFSHLKNNWILHGFETIVVVAGIFGAFSLENWREELAERKIEKEICSDLIASLSEDSMRITLIRNVLDTALTDMETVIGNDLHMLGVEDEDQANELIRRIDLFRRSFFPKYGA